MIELHHGDCLEVLPTLAAGSVDAVVTDPPYGLEFMGKDWDKFSLAEVKKRSGHDQAGTSAGMSKGGFSSGNGYAGRDTPSYGKKRITYRCRTCGKRDKFKSPHGDCPPDWEYTQVDSCPTEMWAFQEFCGQWAAAALRVLKPGGYMLAMGGTRTYHRLACAVEDAGFEIRDCLMFLYATGFPKGKGCLKPAYEPILLCRKPGPKVLALGIDECRVPAPGGLTNGGKRWPKHSGVYAQDEWTQNAESMLERAEPHPAGRWPANVCHDGSAEVLEAFAAFGKLRARGNITPTKRQHSRGVWCEHGSSFGTGPDGPTDPGDTGTAARFYFCAKASKAERGEGNSHPTVKPLSLVKWLVRLVCPMAGGVILDPFLGSGTTALACRHEGRGCIGIELDAGYLDTARRRLAAAEPDAPLFAGESA